MGEKTNKQNARRRRGRPAFRTAVRLIILSSVCLLFSCAGNREQGSAAGKRNDEAPSRHVRSFTRGGAPVRVEVSTSADSITIADQLELVISTIYGPGCTAALPSLADLDLGGFLVRDHRFEGPAATVGDSLRESVFLTLEPQLSGEYIIAPFTVTFVLEGETVPSSGVSTPEDETDASRTLVRSETAASDETLKPVHEIVTDPVEITVGSLLGGETSQLSIRDVHGPVRLPRNMKPWYLGTGILVLAAGLIFAAFKIFSSRRRAETEQPELSAYEKAIARLKRLRAENLVERELYEEFVIELSRIMRVYIGERFDVRAPEKTTEEFLETILHDRNFSDDHRTVLGDFLTSCDLVKFAKHAPAASELQESLDLTLKFITETRPEIKGGAAG